MLTVVDPSRIAPGADGVQPVSAQEAVRSATRAAGAPLIVTVGHPLTIGKGCGGWMMGIIVGPIGCSMWQCPEL
jgi:hypothetical protein